MFVLDNGIPWIAFPPGVPQLGGSCEFATRECLQYCCVMLDFNPEMVKTEKFFMNNDEETIMAAMLAEYYENYNLWATKMIGWFTSGDCRVELTNKILTIIEMLSVAGIKQMVFTRNFKLWEEGSHIKGCKILLSVDSERKAKRLVEDKVTRQVAVPRPHKGRIDIYGTKSKSTGSCSVTWMKTKKGEWYPAVCRDCSEGERGCWEKQ